ncbi:MAG: PAS domain S-box protein [Microscillaceae bacterium]|jgi:PAS domain S-box-containing protein|nr:PAS domain S-box protein [Microscillaceae bacterium]
MRTPILQSDFDINTLTSSTIYSQAKIQNRGFLWVIDSEQWLIKQVSDTTSIYLDLDLTEIIQQDIRQFSFFSALESHLQKIDNHLIYNELPQSVSFPELHCLQPFYVSFYYNAAYLVLEFEPASALDSSLLSQSLDFVNQFTLAASRYFTLPKFLSWVIERLRAFGDFDYLIVSRYEAQNEFEVVAECGADGHLSFLGYRFQMQIDADFFSQIFIQQPIYYFSDLNSPAGYMMGEPMTGHLLDLNWAQLRYPSPQYEIFMQKIGYRSGIRLNIVVKGKFWGTIELFNREARPIAWQVRHTLRSIALIISAKLDTKLDKLEDEALDFYLDQEKHLIQQLIQKDHPEMAFLQAPVNLLRINQATGVVFRLNGQVGQLGNSPPWAFVEKIFDYIQNNVSKHRKIFYTQCLSELLPEAGEYAHLASGVLFLEISRPSQEYIMWFKPSNERKTLWITEPEPKANSVFSRLPLPIKVWLEVQKAHSSPWTSAEIKIAKILRNDLGEYMQFKNAHLQETNTKLQAVLTATQQLNKDLTESRTHLKAIFDSSSNLYIFIGLDYQIIAFNRFAERAMLIMARKPLEVGKSILEWANNGLFQDFETHFTQARQGRKVLLNLKIEARKDFWFEIQYLPVFDAKQQIIGVSFVANDITDKREAILKVIEEKEKAKRYFSIAQVMITVCDKFGNIQLVNQKVQDTLGYSENELIGKYGLDILVVGEKRNEIKAFIDSLANQPVWDKPFSLEDEVWLKTHSGKEILVTFCMTTILSPQGELTGLIASGQDITEKRLAELRLAQSEANLKTVFDHAPLWIFSIDTQYRILIANESFLSYMSQYLAYEFKIGDNLLEVLPKFYQRRATEFFARAFQGENFKVSEWSIFGEASFLERTFTPIWVDEQITSVLVITRNTTQEKKYQEELLVAKEQAETMNRLKSNFLANMSHEIRTPVNGIIGLAQVMKEENNLEDIHFYLDLQIQSGKRLLDTLNNILQLSRLESETTNAYLDNINIHHLLKEILPPLRSLANDKNIQLNFLPCGEEAVCVSDTKLLAQVLIHVIGNAIKFTENGFVTVQTFVQPNQDLQIEVIDTGIGISAEFLPKIFNAFEQESSGMQRTYEGAGLGLTITKKYLDILNGQIEVQSQKGKGSIFKIILPHTVKSLT